MKKIAKEYYFELAQFLMDYHSGQWSRGYRLLCRMRVKNWNENLSEELRDTKCYEYLAKHYADKV